jgi:hypothetical protein
MTALRIAHVATSADDLAACQAATLEVARELGRRAAREDFERQQTERQRAIPHAANAGAQMPDMQNYAATQQA